jgi:S-adenosyl-L-methionine hydrolase (adenosine-forming)
MSAGAPIFLYTDFGSTDIYVGQVKAALQFEAPASPVIDLLNDVPSFEVEAGAHLLAALARRLPSGSVTIAVVDPGVGSARGAVALRADERWFVGPDNGLLSIVAARAAISDCFVIRLVRADTSVSFHGRDIFAPAGALIASGRADPRMLEPKAHLDVMLAASDLPRIAYIDHYGNAMTGIRASGLAHSANIGVAGRQIRYARVFSDVPCGELFWYENSIGLVELAGNQRSAAALLGIAVGDPIAIAA